MTRLIRTVLSNTNFAFFVFAAFSAAALATAFVSQYAYGLQPCVLCVYQRIPYGIIIALGLLGLWFNRKPARTTATVFMGLIALAFIADATIAFYHTGVERHWWKSFLEGCTVPSIEGNITDVLAQIEATPPVRCDEIPWTDPLIGLSMANYNLIACLMLAAAALYATILISRRAPA